jgi:glyceraldehyde 3-phosphate dehydrogenase
MLKSRERDIMNIAINGFGRIGRTFYRAADGKLDITAINDLADIENLKYLLKYDTVYGVYDEEPKEKFLAEKDPENLPWDKMDVDLVVESSGFFTKKEDAEKHLKAGAKRVLITAPSDTADVTIIPGINEDQYDPENHRIVSMGSCTTNCIVPLVAIINDNFKIIKGSFTTVHSYTATQALVDKPDKKDFRRGRSAAENIVPTTTGASKAIYQVFPDLRGKIDSLSIRIPTPTVSMVDFVCEVEKKTDVNEVNKIFEDSAKKMGNALAITHDPLVSTDFKGTPYASIFDASLTSVTEDNLIHVVAWYDNEMGYSNRLVEMCKILDK